KAKQAEHDKGKGKVHELDDLVLDDLDLENRIRKLEVDFGRMLKAKMKKETKQAEHDQLKVNKEVVQISSEDVSSDEDLQDPTLPQDKLLPLPQDPELPQEKLPPLSQDS
nr:hypothetical protein [Tanacetum cinerariifolium]